MVKVDIVGLKGFQDRLNKSPQELRKKVGAEVQFAAEEYRELAIKDAPKDTGSAGLSGKITKKYLTELSAEVVSGSEYSAPMEFGTKGKFTPIPGIDASQFKGLPAGGTFKDMVNNLTNWVRRKGISGTYSTKTRKRTGNKLNQQKEDYRLAYVIARSILKNGVTPHPFFFKQLPIVRKNLLERIRKVL